VTIQLDPRRVAAIISRVPEELVVPVAAELGKRAEHVTMGRFLAYVPDHAVVAAMTALSDEAMLRTAFVLEHKDRLDHALGLLLKASKEEIKRLQDALEAARLESMTDLLTSLPTRECFERTFARMVGEAEANREPVALLIVSIDYFHKFIEVFGHPVGDEVLRVVAAAIKQNIKGKDFAARFDGEEFAVVLLDTGLKPARFVAEHLRNAIVTKELKKVVTGESLGRLTISIGVAMARPRDSAADVIKRAETCLRQAKLNGRNQTQCEDRFGFASDDVEPGRERAG